MADERSKQTFYLITADQYAKARTILEEEEIDPSLCEFEDIEFTP